MEITYNTVCHSREPVGRGTMNTLAAFTVLLLAGLTSSAPINDEVLTVTSDIFIDEFSIYRSEHEIVNLFCPLNSLNFDDDSELETFEGVNVSVFFVEADVTDEATEYKGLYLLKNKKAYKLLDNGRDFAAKTDDSKTVYFAATDGIYVYNHVTNKAEKYGTVSDSFIGIAVTNSSDFIYALSEDHILYKITEEGTKKEEVSDVKNAVQIMLDLEDNLFFVDTEKHVYVKKTDGKVKRVKHLPSNPSHVKLLRPPFVLDNGVPVEVGKKVFGANVDGSSEYQNIVLEAKPSAYAIEATLIQYYAYKKQIYEYNILAIMIGVMEQESIQNYLADKTDDIKKMGSKSRPSFYAR